MKVVMGFLLGFASGAAAALAFGLGSRDLAGREMEGFVASFRAQSEEQAEEQIDEEPK